MKAFSSFINTSALALLILSAVTTTWASPEIGAAIAREFGEATARNIVLIRARATESDPIQWTVYSRDPRNEAQFVRNIVTNLSGIWTAAAAGVDKDMKSAPSHLLDVKKVRWTSKLARDTAVKAAELAQTPFAKVEYQLAASEDTGAPEWGLALQDASGYEVGFCVISAETGAVKFQDWTPRQTAAKPKPSTPESEGERAAKNVKAGVRKAWNWTGNAGKATGGFVRELFKDKDK